jgi:hypothetical protein
MTSRALILLFVILAGCSIAVFGEPEIDIQDELDAEAFEDDDAFSTSDEANLGMNGASGEPDLPPGFDPRIHFRTSPFVKAKTFFPNNRDSRFTLGQTADVTIGVLNQGDESYTVNHVGAYLHSAYDWTYQIQNLTHIPVSVELGPREQVTLTYSFTPDKGLEAINYRLGGYIDYRNTLDESVFKTFFANVTIELAEEATELNASTIFTYALVFAIVGLFAYLGIAVAGSGGKIPGMQKARTSEIPSETWDNLTIHTQQKARVVSKGRRRKQ